MGLSDYKFKEANFNGKKIADLSNTPSSDGMTAEDLKKYFDYIPKTMIAMGTINSIIDLLESTEGAASIGGNLTGVTGVTVQEILDSVKVLIDNRYTKENVDDLLDDKAEKSELSSLINSVSFNKTTGGFTFTTQGGTVYKFDTALEKVAVNFSYNSETQSIDLELADGTTQSIPLGDFITINEVVSSDTIQATIDDGVITLTIKDGVITDSMLSSALMASLRELASAAQQNAEIAEAAKNNASSYSGSSKTSADNAAISEQRANEYANTASEKATAAANSEAAAKEAQIAAEKAVSNVDETVEAALAEAKESGKFDGADGTDGISVTVSSVDESTEDGGDNVVTFSDGKKLTVKNGSKGSQGPAGSDASVTTANIVSVLGYTPADADKVSQLSGEIANLTTLPYGGSKDWLEANGDKTKLYQIGGYVWGYVEANGWTQSGTQFLVVSSESEMTNVGGTEYLLRSGDEGTVYTYTEASGDTETPVYDTLPETANEGDVVAVGGRKYKATLTSVEVPDYTNLAEPNDTNTTDWSLWCNDARIGSDGAYRSSTTQNVSNYIPVANGDVVRWEGFHLSGNMIGLYDSSKQLVSAQTLSNQVTNGHVTDASDITVMIFDGHCTIANANVAYIRFTMVYPSSGTADDVIITVNEEIKTKTETTLSWSDIGEYIPPVEASWSATEETYTIIDSLSVNGNSGDSAVYSVDGYLYTYINESGWMQKSKYNPPTLTIDSELSDTSTNAVQNKIVKLAFDEIEKKVATNANDIITLQNEVEALGGGTSTSETATIPSYWESMVAEKTETVKALQEAGGKDCVNFLRAADPHIPDNDTGRTNDIGKVMAKMLYNCEIPFAMIDGDIGTRASYPTEAEFLAKIAYIPVHLAPLWGTDKLLLGLGNHDGCFGDSTGYYRHQFPPERMWQTYFRGQALDFRRVFSDDGLYFYVDNISQKTRHIVLNTNFGGEYAEDENGWAVNNRFGTSCFGQAQLDWFANVALDMPDGYSATVSFHVPPNVTYTVDKAQFIGIFNAYCDKTTFSGSYTVGVDGWSNSTVNVDFTNAKGDLIAVFAGHVHGDSIDTTTLQRPIITILSAGASANEPYKEDAPTRTAGTDTETSFDVVTINKKTRMIYCTRVGAGADREVSY